MRSVSSAKRALNRSRKRSLHVVPSAHHQVAVGEPGPDALRVRLAVPAQPHGAYQRQDLRKPGDGVGDGGNLAAEDRGQDHHVHESAVGADEEEAGGRAGDRRDHRVDLAR